MIKQISNWLNSGEYRVQIDSLHTKIVWDCEYSDSEVHTSSIFETEIYYTTNKANETKIEKVMDLASKVYLRLCRELSKH